MSWKIPGWRIAVPAPAPGPRAPAPGVPSPCISVCRMDAASGLCEGCWRTLDEIGAWSVLDDDGKRAVWQAIDARRAAAGAPPAGAALPPARG